MDHMYGLSSPDLFRVDDLLDLSNDDLFSSSTSSSSVNNDATSSSSLQPENPLAYTFPSGVFHHSISTDITNELCLPSEDVAELEWLSQFVDDSFSDFPSNSLTGNPFLVRPDTSFPGRSRVKCSKSAETENARNWTRISVPELDHSPRTSKIKVKKEGHYRQQQSPTHEGEVRRCTHCASEKTPQWRTGPLGPKTLCNACGVRFKSGRLVPEYRPAASPTFMLTHHSNSHRKVLELRRQKEVQQHQHQQQIQLHQQHQQQIQHNHQQHNHHHQQQQQKHIYNHHLDFEVC